ncbi:MAG: transcription termination factor Rho [Planctomycetes bacterium RBG_13_62_9]|nr:MAG: transcription termination factor Rho [Planctomycetes bacterium RBG_13_62_9]
MAETESVRGILKRIDRQQFAVRTAERSYRPRHPEVLVLPELIRRYPLVEGAGVTGQVENRKGKPKLVAIETLGGIDPQAFAKRPRYSDLVAIDPFERFDLGAAGQVTMRIVDLIAPIGKGSRQLIVSPPKAGKTVMLEQMVQAIRQCSPKTRVIVLLLDERPEEVTQFRRATEGAEIVASTSDRTADEHVELAELMLAHVQIELECGHEIVLMIDSLTRMGRSFNSRTRRSPGGSRPTMSGGLEAGILEVPRRLFGLARCVENGGSVTIVATCLVDTGSRMDQLIFEEFKGTGNSEIILDRGLAEQRIWPAINLPASGTRKEAKLYTPQHSQGLSTLRRVLSGYEPRGAMESLHKLLRKYPTNKEFLENMARNQ